MVATGVLEPVDKDGIPLDSKYLRLETRDITVSVSIHTEKTVPLTVELSPGFSGAAYRGCTMSASSVTLRGDPKLLASVEELTIFTVMSDEVTEYTIQLTEAMLPGGVSFSGAPDSVTIKLIFEEKAPETTGGDETDLPEPENAPETGEQ